jgi:hypothetical protein
MSRASLVKQAAELARTVRDARGAISKAMQQEDAVKVFSICDEILRRIGIYLSEGGGTVMAYGQIQVLADEARNLLDRATTGRSNPPLRALQNEADTEEEAADMEDEGELPPNDDQDEKDESESELDEGDDSSGARWPSEQPTLPSKKPRKPRSRKKDDFEKSMGSDLTYGVVNARLQGELSADEALNLLLPINRRKGAVINVAQR